MFVSQAPSDVAHRMMTAWLWLIEWSVHLWPTAAFGGWCREAIIRQLCGFCHSPLSGNNPNSHSRPGAVIGEAPRKQETHQTGVESSAAEVTHSGDGSDQAYGFELVPNRAQSAFC
jgi:hypothetical protein